MILVTGSAGYIGSHICHYLDRLGIGYYSIDNPEAEVIMRPSSTLNNIINTH